MNFKQAEIWDKWKYFDVTLIPNDFPENAAQINETGQDGSIWLGFRSENGFYGRVSSKMSIFDGFSSQYGQDPYQNSSGFGRFLFPNGDLYLGHFD